MKGTNKNYRVVKSSSFPPPPLLKGRKEGKKKRWRGRKRGEKEEKRRKGRKKKEKGHKIQVRWTKKRKLPLRFWEGFSNRAWEGFKNRWNNIHPWKVCVGGGGEFFFSYPQYMYSTRRKTYQKCQLGKA